MTQGTWVILCNLHIFKSEIKVLYEKIDCVSYRKETSRKLTSFLQKSPCLFSFLADEEGIIIILMGEQKTFKFDWDYTIPIKSFIHKIKTTLYEYYPRLERSRVEVRPLSAEKASEMIAEGSSLDELPSTESIRIDETFVIDKVILLKNIFILKNEKTGVHSKYKLDNGVFFLKNWRVGKYKNAITAGDEFFAEAVYLGDVNGQERLR